MNTQMDAQMDSLCFDLLDFDMKNPVFPLNAAAIPTPTDQVPAFNDHYTQCIGTPTPFQSITFYSDFTRVVTQRELDYSVKQSIVDFFGISFIPDPTIDLMCAEAFQQFSLPANRAQPQCTTKQGLHSKRSPQHKAKRAKNYNDAIVRTSCENCKEKDLRMKLIKKSVNCNVGDLMKLETFWSGLKMQKSQLATLLPINKLTIHCTKN